MRGRPNDPAARLRHEYYSYPEYAIWVSMGQRCYNPKNEYYPCYGERGIKVCDRWRGRGSFVNFIQDMGRRPSPDSTLDRVENNGNYEPLNCRWATPEEQHNNTRRNVLLFFGGERLSISQWARRYGMGRATLRGRLEAGWDLESALTKPRIRTGRPPR